LIDLIGRTLAIKAYQTNSKPVKTFQTPLHTTYAHGSATGTFTCVT
jgi:hypothetical protein